MAVTYTVEGRTPKSKWAPVMFNSGYTSLDDARRAVLGLKSNQENGVYIRSKFRIIKETKEVEVIESEDPWDA